MTVVDSQAPAGSSASGPKSDRFGNRSLTALATAMPLRMAEAIGPSRPDDREAAEAMTSKVQFLRHALAEPTTLTGKE
jgi:hypothetical protein